VQDSLFTRSQNAPPLETVQSVSAIVGYIGKIVSQNKILAGLRVRGEVSGLSRQASGQTYFDLKEGTHVLKCVAWPNDAIKLPPFKNGDEIIAGGDFGTYPQRSLYQLFVKSVELSGVGILYAQFEALKKRFRDEGLFDDGRKRPLPEFPRRIAVVSARAKGAEDFFETIGRRAPFIEVEFVETRVQGDGAEIDIGAAVDKASRMNVDVIVLTRGGGSYEDLFPFNREPVVRAIIRSKHPVISAIGHTDDVHLSDYVADLKIDTPSLAAEYFGAIADRFRNRVERARTRVAHAARIALSNSAQRFDRARDEVRRTLRESIRSNEQRILRLERRVEAASPQRAVMTMRERLTRLDMGFRQAGAGTIRNARQKLELLRARLDGANPETPLDRGFAIVSYEGRALHDSSDVPEGAQIVARLRRGKLYARVEKKDRDA
jgi:exodeoxyribonuclease VII large subunit